MTGVLLKEEKFGHRQRHIQGECRGKTGVTHYHKSRNYQELGERPGTDPSLAL